MHTFTTSKLARVKLEVVKVSNFGEKKKKTTPL